jgi:hypothetical protein
MVLEGSRGDWMAHRSSATPTTLSDSQLPARAGRDRWERIVVRFLIAVCVSAAADVLWWLHEPRHLIKPIEVVGYAPFSNFDYNPSFLAYRLLVYAFPVGALLVYSVLAWRGPLRRPPGARRRRATAQLLDLPAAEPDVEATEPTGQTGPRPMLSMLARLLLPALVVGCAASAARYARGFSGLWLAGLIVYPLVVLIVAAGISWVRARPRAAEWAAVRSEIPLVNGLAGAMAAVAGLWFVSLHTGITVQSDHHFQHWPWLPWWLALAGIVVIAAWGLLRLRGGRAPAAIEQRLLAVVVGSAAVFLVTSQLPGQLGGFQGFDDAQNLVGAHLLSQGYFPWRDFQFIHGLWSDALQSVVGFAIFGSTRWGSAAGTSVLLVPLVWVVLYLFAVWFCRRNRWFLACIVVLLISGLPNLQDTAWFPDVRFIAAPVILVLLGETLRRRSVGWCAALMFAIVVQAVLVPETLFLALPVLLVVVAADLTHRPVGGRIWPALRRSSWCAAIGVVLVGAWCAFLAVNHALSAWIQYFYLLVPSHAAEGAIPPTDAPALLEREFALCILLVLITFWSVAAQVRSGRQLSVRDWVTVAAAGFVALYGEEALGRFDLPHIDYVVIAAMPLILLWAERALTAADDLVRRAFPPELNLLRSPATVAAAVIIVLLAPDTGQPTIIAAARNLPAREHAWSYAEPTIPRLGYTVPGAVSPELISDLATALNTYAGRSGTVFDMTNSLGYIYFLLNRRPASPFVHVSMAQTTYSQQLLINSLRRTRPPVALFDSDTIGLSSWDGINNNVRHFAVSQYLLDNYRPVLRTQGVLLLLRDDLMASRPPVPRLQAPAVSTDLYFGSSTCAWGDVPDFLPSVPAGRSIDLPVTSRLRTGDVITGVVQLPAGLSLASYDLLTLHGDRPIGTSAITISDTEAAPAGHDITTTAMPASGTSLSVRVGSCLQWHGYSTTRLYVRQVGGTAITSLELSGVAG